VNHEFYMDEALAEARAAYEAGEIPIGAVVVRDNEIIARGHNVRETSWMPPPMPRLWPSAAPAPYWEAGGFWTAPFM
jgi:hypothetical protein